MSSLFIPYPIINIILEYLSGLNNRKWKPVVDIDTGSLKWNINKYNKVTIKIESILQFKLNNPPIMIPILCGHVSCIGLLTLIEQEPFDSDSSRIYNSTYLLEYDRQGFTEEALISIWKDKEDEKIIVKNYKNYLYRDYLPDPSFWITSITGLIWNDYGITLILNDNIDGWFGEWNYVNNEWRFIVDLPPEFIEEDDNQWDNEWDDEFDP
jgi:hypothetical protein